MSKLTTAAITLAAAIASGAAFADDSSMSRWTGDSYRAFEAVKASGHQAPSTGNSTRLNASPDNSMSRWDGGSYVAFEEARTAPETISIADARMARVAANHADSSRIATRGRTPVNPFRNDTGA